MRKQNGYAVGVGPVARAAVAALGLAALWGCAQVGGKAIPTASQGFRAADVLPNPPAQVYAAATAELDDEGIAVATQDKEAGRITSDYVPGPSTVSLIGGTNSATST